MEETQSVRLENLGQSKNATELVRGWRNADCEQRITSFCGSDEMAHRADAADTRHEGWHLGERTTFAKFLKSAELGDVEMRVLHHAVSAKVKSDFGVPFDPGYRVDDNRLVGDFSHFRLRTAFSR